MCTVETQFNEPLYKEVLGVTNEFFYPSNSKIYEKEPQYMINWFKTSEVVHRFITTALFRVAKR